MVRDADAPIPNILRAVWEDFKERLFMHGVWIGVFVVNWSVGEIRI